MPDQLPRGTSSKWAWGSVLAFAIVACSATHEDALLGTWEIRDYDYGEEVEFTFARNKGGIMTNCGRRPLPLEDWAHVEVELSEHLRSTPRELTAAAVRFSCRHQSGMHGSYTSHDAYMAGDAMVGLAKLTYTGGNKAIGMYPVSISHTLWLARRSGRETR